MVGLVIVSHSRKLAESLVELISQVSQEPIAMAIAAGVGTDREDFGTDAVEIMEAIQSVYSESGVLVLMDLGSAVLSAELALELLPEEMHPYIRFCAAPLVEGAIAAAVQSSLGSDLDTVCEEARTALLPKAEQLGQLSPETAVQPASPPAIEAGPGETIRLTLKNEHGLHARPAAKFVQLAASYEADVQVKNLSNEKGPVTAKSLNALATLGAVHQSQIEISARGPEAGLALQALQALVEDNFGESEFQAPAPADLEPEMDLLPVGAQKGIPVSEGVAMGPAFHFRPPRPVIPSGKTDDPEAEWERFERALAATRTMIEARHAQVAARVGEEQAGIFSAHLLILNDPEILASVRTSIYQDRYNAGRAWHTSIENTAETYRALENPYLQQRAVDVEDVGDQLLHNLAGSTGLQEISFDEPVILIADDLTPTQTAQLDMGKVLGLVTIGGGPTSHSAILARGLGIPAVSGADPGLLDIQERALLALDGFSGAVWLDPPAEQLAELKRSRQAWLDQRQKLLEHAHQKAITQDNHPIEIAANAGNVQDAQAAIKNGAEAIGLLRTEFLFLTRSTPPDESEQFDVLAQIGHTMGDRPVIIRTLDVGGDKNLPYIDLPEEANPFLGVRAIRLSLKNQSLFHTQLRAILRAAAGRTFRIMFPMVTNVSEVEAALKILEEAHQSLVADGQPHLWPIKTGIMIETPAAALLSNRLAPLVDFFSIGTNDLTQYTLAAERGNPALSSFADALHPAVLRLIARAVEQAEMHEVWVGVCGELAGDPHAVPVLVGLGVRELSMNPASIPKVKELIRKLDAQSSKSLAKKVLTLDDAPGVRAAVLEYLEENRI
jgi:phosphocarrier protein FPr